MFVLLCAVVSEILFPLQAFSRSCVAFEKPVYNFNPEFCFFFASLADSEARPHKCGREKRFMKMMMMMTMSPPMQGIGLMGIKFDSKFSNYFQIACHLN